MPLITRTGKRLIDEAVNTDLITTDLTMYQACNSLWKMVTLLKTLSLEDATDIATTLKEPTSRNVIQTTSFSEIDFSRTLNIAKKEQA